MALTFNTQDGTVSIPKNSDGILKVGKKVDGVPADFVDGEKVYLQVKQSPTDTSPVINKEVTSFVDGEAQIQFVPSDTASLNAEDYYYDIWWTDLAGSNIRIYPENEADCDLPLFVICPVVSDIA